MPCDRSEHTTVGDFVDHDHVYTFNPNELWIIGIVAYAAVISTFVPGWDAYKCFWSGAGIILSVSTGTKMVVAVWKIQRAMCP